MSVAHGSAVFVDAHNDYVMSLAVAGGGGGSALREWKSVLGWRARTSPSEIQAEAGFYSQLPFGSPSQLGAWKECLAIAERHWSEQDLLWLGRMRRARRTKRIRRGVAVARVMPLGCCLRAEIG